jgi:hypothetical protein
MGLSATTTQIVELAKRGFDSKQIAQALSLTEESVLAVVTQDSAAVKDIYENSLEKQFARMESGALEEYERLAYYAENENVREKALRYILDQRLGLKKPRDRVTIQNNFNFLADRAKRAREIRDATVIDVQVEPVKVNGESKV